MFLQKAAKDYLASMFTEAVKIESKMLACKESQLAMLKKERD